MISKTSSIKVFSILMLLVSLTFSSTFIDSSQADFDNGNYSNVFYNAIGFVQLNATFSNGDYTSQIFDADNNASWITISWTQGGYYQQELPNNCGIESGDEGVDMTGNVLLMHMDEASGTIVDYSREGNNGTPTGFEGDEYGAAGVFNTSLDFDGIDDIVIGPSSNDITGDNIQTITFSAWVKHTHAGDNGYIAAIKRSAVHSTLISLDAGNAGPGNLGFLTRNHADTTHVWLNHDGGYNDGEWHHLVAVVDGLNRLLYIDGVERNSDNQGMQSVNGNTAEMCVGGFSVSSILFDGSIDEVAIWNRSLSADEILNIYKRGALRLNLKVKSCDDENCSGETFTNINDTSPQTLSISDNQYFQYNFEFLTENPAYAPRLYSVTVAYDAAPSISLTSPANDSSTSDTTPDFTFNANDDDQPTLNCELFINDGACGTDNSVTSGSSTTLTSNQTLPLGDYYWYVDCSDGTFTTQSETRNLTIITQPSQSSGRDSLSVETEGRCINQAVKITVEREGEKEQEVEIKVTYYGPSLNQLYEIETDSNGQVSFTPTKEGKYRIVAKKNDCKKEKIYIEIEQCEPPCTSNNDCLSTENCISDNCIPITGECGYAENHEWTNYECCSDNQCAEDQTCSGNKCTLIPCECGIILQRTCIGFECCSNTDCSEKELCEGYECIPAECTINSDCSKNETCSQGSCILVAGDCGYISEHEWIAYECCLDFDCKQGENCSEHICKSIILSTEEKEKADALINDAGTFLKEITTKGETNEKADLLLTASKHLLEQEDYLLAGALASMAKNEITETKLATTEYASAENDQGIFSFMGTTSATILFVLLFAAWAWVIVSRTKLT